MIHWDINAAADKHPNRMPFKGILTIVDKPSDKSPGGCRGHRVNLTYTAAKAALKGLVGMAVDFKSGWDGHDARNKIGIITSADFEEKNLVVGGFIYGRDFPEVLKHLNTPDEPLGMSYELCDAHVEDMRAEVWKLTRATFTGAAILFRTKAAYKTTSFGLVTN